MGGVLKTDNSKLVGEIWFCRKTVPLGFPVQLLVELHGGPQQWSRSSRAVELMDSDVQDAEEIHKVGEGGQGWADRNLSGDDAEGVRGGVRGDVVSNAVASLSC
jgi:hypothetical protein